MTPQKKTVHVKAYTCKRVYHVKKKSHPKSGKKRTTQKKLF